MTRFIQRCKTLEFKHFYNFVQSCLKISLIVMTYPLSLSDNCLKKKYLSLANPDQILSFASQFNSERKIFMFFSKISEIVRLLFNPALPFFFSTIACLFFDHCFLFTHRLFFEHFVALAIIQLFSENRCISGNVYVTELFSVLGSEIPVHSF